MSKNENQTVIDPEGFLKIAKSSKKDKAAQLLVLMGTDEAAKVMAYLEPNEIDSIARQIAMLPRVDAAEAKAVLEEFGREFNAGDSQRIRGGVDVARSLLAKAFGDSKAEEILMKSAPELLNIPFAFLNRLSFDQLTGILKDESPRTLALIMNHINRTFALKLLKILPGDIQAEVIIRMVQPKRVSQEVMARIEEVLLQKLRESAKYDADNRTEDGDEVDGRSALAEMMRFMDREDERRLLEELEHKDPELAEQIKSKLYTMDSILNIRDRDLQEILLEFSENDIALLIMDQNPKIKERILEALSSRRRILVADELELLESTGNEVDAVVSRFIEKLKKGEYEGRYVVVRENDEYI